MIMIFFQCKAISIKCQHEENYKANVQLFNSNYYGIYKFSWGKNESRRLNAEWLFVTLGIIMRLITN